MHYANIRSQKPQDCGHYIQAQFAKEIVTVQNMFIPFQAQPSECLQFSMMICTNLCFDQEIRPVPWAQ